jgi:hypothetical protein
MRIKLSEKVPQNAQKTAFSLSNSPFYYIFCRYTTGNLALKLHLAVSA